MTSTTPTAHAGGSARDPATPRTSSVTRTLATARRVLQQLGHDRRSVAMIVFVPSLLMLLFRYIFDASPQVFDRVGPQMLGIFPFIIMFLLTSVAMVRERTSGTLERLLTTPLGRGELIGGYALAFGLAALVQAVVSSAVAIWWLGLDIEQPWLLALFAVTVAVMGTAIGLLVSAFSRTEFQAVQFMPVVVLPQILLCGLLVPREDMPEVLHWVSNVLPLSYASDAFSEMVTATTVTTDLARNFLVLLGCCVVAVVAASFTLRRRTP